MPKYEQHALGALLPKLSRQEYRDLREDIRQHGQRRPVDLFEGKILDGWHRYQACEEIGVDVVAEEIIGDYETALNLIGADLLRRSTNASQRAIIVAQLTGLRNQWQEEARKRQGTRTDLQPPGNVAGKFGETRELAASQARTSPRTMQDAFILADEGKPKDIEAVRAGLRAVSAAARDIRERRPPKERVASVEFHPKNTFTVEEWNAMPVGDRAVALAAESKTKMNNTSENEGIEWAHWSWNPITGCEHGCTYCYARDLSERFTDAFPNGFKPTFIPERLRQPANTKLPEVNDPAEAPRRHVFTCSMADLFGVWVPKPWITAVLDTCRANPKWVFLVLTKYPSKVVDFEIPDNVWVGATVDIQARVKATEKAFERITAKVKWVSVEPMLEPIRFNQPELFQWFIIGGSSRSSQTPEWVPPMDWICALHAQARAAGAEVFHKRHFGFTDYMRSRSYPWCVQPQRNLPHAFEYWKKATA